LAFGAGGVSLPGGGQGNVQTGQTAPAPVPQAGGGNNQFGIPNNVMAMLLSGDAGLMATGKAMLEQNKPINVRPGGTVYTPGKGAEFTAPQGGINTTWGANGPQQALVPGAQGAMGQLAASQSGAQESGRAPYQLETLNTPGAPTLMTREQAIEAATGRPMPRPGAAAALRTTAQTPEDALSIVQDAERRGQPASVGVQPQKLPAPLGMQVPRRAPGLPLQDQGQSAEQREFGQFLGKQSGSVMEDAAKAAVGNRYLDVMEGYAKDFNPGKLAPLQSSLNQWAQGLGINVPDEDKKAAGSIQALTSMAIKMAGQATRQADAQPSQLQYFKILESMPNAERTPEGFNKIVSYMRDLNNLSISKAQELQKWRQERGTAEGFEAQWPNIAKTLPFAWNTNVDQAITQAGRAQAATQPARPVSTIKRGGVVRWEDL